MLRHNGRNLDFQSTHVAKSNSGSRGLETIRDPALYLLECAKNQAFTIARAKSRKQVPGRNGFTVKAAWNEYANQCPCPHDKPRRLLTIELRELNRREGNAGGL